MNQRDVAGARVVNPGDGKELPYIGSLTASSTDIGGALEVIEYVGPAVPPPHVHREHDEVFYILKGPFRFLLGHEWVDADTGSLVVVPRGTRHGFETQPGCRALLITIPAGLEGFFTELGQGLAEGLSSQEIRARLAGRYDSHPDPG
jgi:mannose-6-phosphate isomerase-like protein (cupin superfamily)